ncbi:Maf family nucleotide pyrophosphatase [Maribacter sp. CXY002]|uniref:Maf family nucleotide pyrophosphatase n=1 Tax=Maribacter luteocoastalis TaxID=3407671 RepID=UPI003B6740F3
MLLDKLKGYQIILASGSPRRKQFFKDLNIDVVIKVNPVDEIYPEHLQAAEISDYLAKLKASVFKGTLRTNDILITSDTVVWYKNESLAKASNKNEATQMLLKLSGDWHEVITSVCFTTEDKEIVKNHSTKVKFKTLTEEEINYYIENFKPFDKAGAYGIQEWIGLIGVEEIKGSYTNVNDSNYISNSFSC